MGELLSGYGFGKDFSSQLRESFERNRVFPESPERFRIVEESDELLQLGISYLPCPGHSQSDLVYLLDEYAVSGDALLRNIFQAPLLDIDLETFAGRFRNYHAYCSSLLNLAQLRGRQIMPGHRQFVSGVDDAILFYVTMLLERVAQLLPFSNLPMNVIIDRLFNGRLTEPFFVYLKVSEVVFMLDFIEDPVLLKSAMEKIGLFVQVSELYGAVT